jgi:hypothetical protein
MIIWLVVEPPAPLKNMSSSVGMMIFQSMEGHKIHVPKHQPAMVWALPIGFNR